MRYLIVTIPDLCTLTYFKLEQVCFNNLVQPIKGSDDMTNSVNNNLGGSVMIIHCLLLLLIVCRVFVLGSCGVLG